jgi:hypothetical protein
MIRTLLLLTLLFALCQCAARKPQLSQASTTIIERDTIWRDSIVTVPGERIIDTLTVQIDCDKNGKGSIRTLISSKAGQRSSSQVVAAGNTIIHQSDCMDLQVKLTSLETRLRESKAEKETITETVEVAPSLWKNRWFWLCMLLIAAWILNLARQMVNLVKDI